MPVHQPQGDDDVWCAVAYTEHGRIPGKARDGTCWYGYGGEELTTENFKILKYGKISREPLGKPPGEQNDGAGFMWCAIANTENGKIPGKADRDGQCWYTYGGEEIETDDFRYVCENPNARKPQGWQSDGIGEMWCAVANTEYGPIPGKAMDGTCWYSYGGAEYSTDDFEIIPYAGISSEPCCDPHAEQDDGAQVWCALAQTEHGRIPGKATADGCWYGYGGEEHECDNFRYVYKHEAKPQGNQDDFGDLWCAVAVTDWGAIPGKSDGDTCWYSYGGEEHETTDFKLVKDGGLRSGEPVGSAHGIQLDFGRLYCAVANSEWGRIPGKAAGDTCWFPYGGAEHTTDDFDFVYARRFTLRDDLPRDEWDDASWSSASFSFSEDEDDIPTESWSGSFYAFNKIEVDLGMDATTVAGSGNINGEPFEIDEGEIDGSRIKFVLKMEGGDEKYYWGEVNPWNSFIFGKISDDEMFSGSRNLCHLRKA
eukprot:CAMPEP_0172478932 /NCGR_PEP_ID=MMETSP1066-20121228/3153_1 /TAXON_ID=671091 /ORGANISM="Coscinodiscus wailesii, Strain CCMP2513" /LENGTH=480 /DNA_ID=CAMNT_0013238887 /DNA_START=1270 /DNA_END=2712 /DNA_ORIENTATION=+